MFSRSTSWGYIAGLLAAIPAIALAIAADSPPSTLPTTGTEALIQPFTDFRLAFSNRLRPRYTPAIAETHVRIVVRYVPNCRR
jgi:hypothetical protein